MPLPPPEVDALDWLQVWAVGRYALRLTDADLAGLTFAEFAALAEQHRQTVRAADQRAALVASVLAQSNGIDRTIDDFMPKTEHERAMERYAAMMNQLAAWQGKAARHRRAQN